MSLGFGVVQLDVTIVNTALDTIGRSLGGGVSDLQWVASIYTITFAALILTAGAMGDRFGAKRIFMSGFAVFSVASLACALAPTATVLIAARAVQGAAPRSWCQVRWHFSTTRIRKRRSAAALSAGGWPGPALRSLPGRRWVAC
jgi:DHA2 family methylenomycin A resistance protein-like MFS transporter